ncbi:carbohydrate ABC transporter permease [Bacillus sp. FJAT-27225]|uniref:carbohydrate ABC transporter permease n=1 Tax=Bacillus sp. FJAT-27225 TaxID=1743144 RepID=UPI001C307DE1|nr:sugar ABC transporter permease [Bacillus sp. FJAT-27225]
MIVNSIKKISKHRNPYLFISPFFILFFVFQLYPMVETFRISFTEWNGIGEPKDIGFANYKLLMKDYMFWDAVKNTFIYWITALLSIIPLALLISVLLNYKNLRARRFFQSMTFFPYVCATVAMGLIFNIMFDENSGIINEIAGLFGFNSVQWLTSLSLSKIPVIVLNVWRHTPWFTLIILSGLMTIPTEYYEAARIDGANVFQQFFKITLPSLGGILLFCFITITVDSWNIFTEPYILKGPGTSNISLFQYMYESSFKLFKFGYAAAIGYILTIILIVLSVIQLVLMRKRGGL